MLSRKTTMLGGLLAAFVALFLFIGASTGHAMAVRCDGGQGTAVETSMHLHKNHAPQHYQRDAACCAVTCGICLTVLPHISVSSDPTSAKSTPVFAAAAYMAGQVPSPDLGPPRKSV